MTALNRFGKLKFNPADPDANCSENIGVFLRDGYGLQLTSTSVDVDTQALDVFLHGFDQAISNEDGYLYVDFVDDLLSPDGYLNVSIGSPIEVNVDVAQYAEDSAHTSGDLGNFTLSVRIDDINGSNAAYLAGSQGDYQGLFTNEKGELYTHDEDAYQALLDVVAGLDNINFESSLVNEDGYLYVDFVNDLLSQDGYLQVTVTNPTPSASEYAEDSPHASGDFGSFVMAVRNDTETSLVDNNGDYAPFQVNSVGRLKVDMDWSSNIPTNPDGYLYVDIGDASAIQVDTVLETEIVDCPLPDGYTGNQSFIADSYRRLWINSASAVGGTTSVKVVNTTAALLVTVPLGGRTRFLLQNKGDEVVYLGFQSGVTADDNTTTGGFELSCGDFMSLEIADCLELYAIVATGTSTVKIMELA
jgi:hypothetical protein